MVRVQSMAIGVFAAAFVACGGSVVGAGGGSSTLDGTWTESQAGATLAFALSSGGSLTETVTDPACSGSITTSGQGWTATATTVTVTGTANCSGTLTCGATSIACQPASPGTYPYTLSDGDNTLTVNISSERTLVLTRQ